MTLDEIRKSGNKFFSVDGYQDVTRYMINDDGTVACADNDCMFGWASYVSRNEFDFTRKDYVLI